MPINSELLEILCCPATRVDLKIMAPERIQSVNEEITKGGVNYKDGKPVDKPLQEALITVDDKIIYRIDDEIPVMLVEMGIETEQLENF